MKVKIDDLDMFGLGIAHDNDKVIFIDNALPGEEIEWEKVSCKNNLIKAKNLKIIKKSEFREIPLCPYFNNCGGCDIQHLIYVKSLEYKKEQIILAFKKIASINLDDFEIVSSDNKYFYRNKLVFKISENEGRKFLSMYKKNSHDEIEIKSCKLISPKIDIVIKEVNNYLNTINLKVYDEKLNKNDLKHLVIKLINNNLLLTFVLQNKTKLENIEILYNTLKQYFSSVGISININKNNKEILSNTFINLIGKNEIEYESFDIIQKISNASFLQVNENVAKKLYSYVLNNIDGNIVNCYSGAGLLSGILAKNNLKNQVYAIEINKSAHTLAEKLKEENNLLNLSNYCGDSFKVLNELNLKNFNLIVDPPRSGLDDNMLNLILKTKPQKIVYVSCNKITMAKNLKKLISEYNILSVLAFDMFPQTVNCEIVAILKLKQ